VVSYWPSSAKKQTKPNGIKKNTNTVQKIVIQNDFEESMCEK